MPPPIIKREEPSDKGATTSSSRVSPMSGEEHEDTPSQDGDAMQEDEFISPPTPTSFRRVVPRGTDGEVSARTHLNYIHPENAHYLMQKKVQIRSDKGKETLKSNTNTPGPSRGHGDKHSSIPFPNLSLIHI